MTWTANATGGSAPLQYEFWRRSTTGAWMLGQAYSTSNTYTWTPGSADAGSTFVVEAWVKSAGSPNSFDAWLNSATLTITAPPALSITSLTPNVTSPVAHGTAITWTASTTGGAAPVLYEFWKRSSASGWTMVQGYSTVNTYTWTPGMADVGSSYLIEVWVLGAGSMAGFDAWMNSATVVIN